MKKIFISISILVFVFSCSTTDDPISDNDEQFISLKITKDNIEDNYKIEDDLFIQGATYFLSDSIGYTGLSLMNEVDSEPHYLSISFPGKEVGTIEWSNSRWDWNRIIIIKKLDDPLLTYKSYDGYTNVTKYGSIGERIEGNLSGILVEMPEGDTLFVQGEFSMVRRPDYEPEP